MPVNQLNIDVAALVSVCAELMLYGVFLNLFLFFIAIVLKRKATRTNSSKVFLVGSCLMFAVATTHIALNMYRLLRAYVLLREEEGPVHYLNDLSRKENIASDVVNAVMTWLGDGLAIYRCYIIWDNSLKVIVLPVILVIVSVVSNAVAIHTFAVNPSISVFSPSLTRWINTLYAVALIQNVYTTVLISYRVYHQEQSFVNVGLRIFNKRGSLMPIARIVVESAMGYTAVLVVLIVLYAINHNAQFIVQEMTVPCVGIVFTLITVRLAMRNSRALRTTTVPVSTGGLAWAMHGDSTTDTGQTDTNLRAIEGDVPLDTRKSTKAPENIGSTTYHDISPPVQTGVL